MSLACWGKWWSGAVSESITSGLRRGAARLKYERMFGLQEVRAARVGDPADTIEKIAAEIMACTRCELCGTRTNAVPGEGSSSARIVFVGEAPGSDEDIRGRPFVGPAGRLLDRMMTAIDLERSAVFIANIVKCRPPGNRTPLPGEIAACMPFLRRQIAAVRPRVVCALGSVAVRVLLRGDALITEVRGTRREMGGFTLVPTYHPAYLLRNPSAKREAWHDLRLIRAIVEEGAE